MDEDSQRGYHHRQVINIMSSTHDDGYDNDDSDGGDDSCDHLAHNNLHS